MEDIKKSELTFFSPHQTVTSSCSFFHCGMDFWTPALEKNRHSLLKSVYQRSFIHHCISLHWICSWMPGLCTERSYLSVLLQSFGLFAVDVPLHTCFSSTDEHGMPKGESSKSYCHWAAENKEVSVRGVCRRSSAFRRCGSPGQYPEKDDALMSSGFSEGVVWRRCLIITLKGTGKRRWSTHSTQHG